MSERVCVVCECVREKAREGASERDSERVRASYQHGEEWIGHV